jgi:hypothetical protein
LFYPYARLGLVLALLVACAAEYVQARGGIIRPKRLVHLFDFEEPENFESLPMNWFIIGRPAETSSNTFFREPLHHDLMERPGFPSYTQVRFDETHVISGRRSFYLGLNGGSAGAFLEVGTIPAVPQSDYLVTAAVRTEALEHASAYLSAYFVDRDGQRIDASVVESKPIRTRGAWTQVAIKLRGDVDGAVWIGLQVELRQRARQPNDPLGQQRIMVKDLRGQAWFDDIAIWQLPRIEVATQSRVNLIRGPQRPRLDISVRDLTSQELSVDLVVYDHTLRPAAIDRRELGPGAPRYWSWEPDLPGFGWYLVDMRINDRHADETRIGSADVTTPVARTFGAFTWLPPAVPIHAMDADRFQINAAGLPPRHFSFLTDLLDATGIRSMAVSVWDEQTDLADIEPRKDQIDQVMQWLYLSGRSASLSLDPIPLSLADAINSPAADPISVLGTDRSQWLTYLTPTLLSHGQRVRRWLLGSPDQAYGFFTRDLPAILGNVQTEFASLAPSPELVIPWRLDQSRRKDLPDSLYYLIDVPPAVAADQLPAYLAEWHDIKDKLTLSLREPPADEVSHARRVTDLAIRMITAWEEQPGAMSVSGLWTEAAQRKAALVPDPLLGVFANVAQQLAGRRVVGRLMLGGGLKVLILDGPAGPALVAWSKYPGGTDSELNLYMGENPVAVDIWGNRHAIPLSDNKHRLALTDTPVFITGIDAQLALFRAGFKINEPFIESTQTLHERVLTLTNPWPMTVSGNLQITGPEGWTSRPTRHFFSIPAGRTVTLPTALQFPVSEVAGPKQLTARFEFTADQTMVIDLALPIEVGLKDVTMNATVALGAGEDGQTEDAGAAAVVTNTGNQTLSLYVFANLPGHPIQERIVADLGPGETVVRRFHFPGAGRALRDNAMRMGIREIDGPRMLNQRLSVEDD